MVSDITLLEELLHFTSGELSTLVRNDTPWGGSSTFYNSLKRAYTLRAGLLSHGFNKELTAQTVYTDKKVCITVIV
jgi:hypothetical protein